MTRYQIYLGRLGPLVLLGCLTALTACGPGPERVPQTKDTEKAQGARSEAEWQGGASVSPHALRSDAERSTKGVTREALEPGDVAAALAREREVSRARNIALRSGAAPDYGAYGQGFYPAGKPMAERPVKGGIMIGAQFATTEQAAILKSSGYLPFRKEMSDAELLEAMSPELRKKHRDQLSAIVNEMHDLLGKAPEMPQDGKAPELPAGAVPEGAEKAYAEWFQPDGALKERDFLWSYPPGRELQLWGAAYQSTREDRWARAVIEVMEYYYHHVRPPAGKIKNRVAEAQHMWRTLNMGAFTPAYLEAYIAIKDWPGLTDAQKANFVKGAIERAQFLHFTTTPAFPWLNYNPFGYANWLLYQLQGELAIACAFPGLKEAPKWREHVAEAVALQAAWSIQPDGSHDEFSYDYARQVGQQFNWCVLTLLRHGYEVPSELRGNLLRLNAQFMELFGPGSQKIPFGDSHPGLTALRQQAKWGSTMFMDARMKHFAEPTGDLFLQRMAAIVWPENPEKWVSDYEALEPIPPSAERASSILPDAGLAVMRTGWGAGDNAVSFLWRGSDRVAHSGREHLAVNFWAGGEPVAAKLMGTRSYTGHYPEGYQHTPRLSNLVLLEDEKGALLPFQRTTGALRNWASHQGYDFVDADHAAWGEGRVTSRRRVLYIKPGWLVMIDDVIPTGASAPRKVGMQWQMHVGQQAPEVEGDHAVWQRGGAYGMLWLPGALLVAEELPVKNEGATYLVKARRAASALPGRWVSVIHFGTGTPVEGLKVSAVSGRGFEGVKIPTAEGELEVIWEPVDVRDTKARGRFIYVSRGKKPEFAAADHEALPAVLKGALEVSRADEKKWNGRIYEAPAAGVNEVVAGEVRNFRRLPWSGQPQLKEESTELGRFAWETDRPAVQTLLYRRAGSTSWQRVVQPGAERKAWLLAPDLERGASYEVQAVGEGEDGAVYRSKIERHSF